MFMIGSPEDTEKTIKDTIEYATILPNQLVQFSVFTPYPGTPVFREYEQKITTSKFEDFTQFQLVFDHANFKPVDIINLLNYSYSQYYLNPRWIFYFSLRKFKEIYDNLYYRVFRFPR